MKETNNKLRKFLAEKIYTTLGKTNEKILFLINRDFQKNLTRIKILGFYENFLASLYWCILHNCKASFWFKNLFCFLWRRTI